MMRHHRRSTLPRPSRHPRRRAIAILAGLPALGLLAACADSPADRVIGVDATADVTAVIRLDATGNGVMDASDPGVPGVRILLRFAGTSHVLASAPSDADGVVRMTDVPVGSYVVEVDAGAVSDSLHIVTVTRDDLILAARTTEEIGVLLSHARMTIEEARLAPVGRRVFVDGVVLNARTNFGDNTIHLAGASRAIRLTRPGAVNVAPGDSVRVLGTRNVVDGQPTLDQVAIFALGPGTLPIARILGSGAAASADGGTRDASLVRVTAATILQRLPTEAGFELHVDDGSGLLTIRLDAVAPFPVQQYEPQAVLDVRGVLVPTGTPGEWALRPRVVADIVVVAAPPPPE